MNRYEKLAAARIAHAKHRANAKTKLRAGDQVRHATHGIGRIVAEWGMVEVSVENKQYPVSGRGIYDVMFGSSGTDMHCCRAEYLIRL